MIAKIFLSNSRSSIQNEIEAFLTNRKMDKKSPDVLYFENDAKLGVEQIRKIKEFLSIKSYTPKGKIVVLENGENLNNQAQNALLKSVEELHEDNLFLIGATTEDKFLPTILSRCEIVRVKGQGSRVKGEPQIQEIDKLLNSTIGERFEYIEKLKDKEDFLRELIHHFHRRLPVDVKFMHELLKAEQWEKQNVNIRAILEYLMLVMPKISQNSNIKTQN